MTPDSEWGRLMQELVAETERSRQARENALMPRAPEPVCETSGFPVTTDEE